MSDAGSISFSTIALSKIATIILARWSRCHRQGLFNHHRIRNYSGFVPKLVRESVICRNYTGASCVEEDFTK